MQEDEGYGSRHSMQRWCTFGSGPDTLWKGEALHLGSGLELRLDQMNEREGNKKVGVKWEKLVIPRI